MRRTVICREGIYYLVVLVLVFLAAILREVNTLLLFGALLTCPVFLAWSMTRKSVQGLEIHRRKTPHVMAGEVFHIIVELKNTRRRFSSWAIVVEDTIRLVRRSEYFGRRKKDQRVESRELIRMESQALRPAVYFEYLKPGETVKKSYSGCIPKRGLYRLGPMSLTTRFPVGFFRSSLRLEEKEENGGEFYVLPRWGRLAPDWFSKQHQSDENQQRRKRFRPSRLTGEFLGVRHWQSGDVKKWIHWRASAKHNELVVRQFEQHQNRDAAVVLDLFQPHAPSVAELESIELAVSFAATLVNELAKRSGSTLLFGSSVPLDDSEKKNGHDPQSQADLMLGQVSLPLIEGMMERLAVIEPTAEDGLADLLLQILSSTDSNADIFLVSPRPLDWSAESERFTAIKNDPRFRALSQRVRFVDTSSPDLAEIFTP